MSKFLEKFCRQISHDKDIAADLFQALENVVCYKLYAKVPTQVFAGQPSNGHGMILQELEAVLNQLISDDLTGRSWRMGWDRFFANFVFDLEDGKLRFALKHQPEDSQLLLLDDRFDILGRNIGPTQN